MKENVNIEEFIEEMTKVRPEVLTEDAKKLFKTINMIIDENLSLKEALKGKCEIADERNQLLVENQKLNKVIDCMADMMQRYNDMTGIFDNELKDFTSEEIKLFFIKRLEEKE